jgi:ankyrin repeat protein
MEVFRYITLVFLIFLLSSCTNKETKEKNNIKIPPQLSTSENYIEFSHQTSIDDVRKLIDQGVDVNKPGPGREGYGPPIYQAVWNGYTEIVSLLINAGADINALHNGDTPLILAIAEGKKEIAILLIEAGADVNITHYQGRNYTRHNALEIAFQGKQWEIVSRLLEAGADPKVWDIYGYYDSISLYYQFLEALVMNGRQNELTFLMEHGLNLQEEGWSHLIFTALRDGENNIDMLKFLVEAGMDINVIRRDSTLLQYAIRENRTAALWLINHGVNVNYGSKNEMSALMWAVNRGDIELAKILLEAGADINYKRGTQSALSHALFRGEDEIALWLIERGADVKVVLVDGWSTLMWAVYSGNAGLANKLIEAGVDVNYRTPKTGQTALMIAAGDVNYTTTHEDSLLYDNLADEDRDPAMVRLLLEAGADISLVNGQGRNALYYAENASRNEEIIRLIRERM